LRAIPVRSEFAPCGVRPEKHIAMNLVQRHASWNSTNPRVTIVEADITLALALSHNLKTEGYVVESVDRGDEPYESSPTRLPILSCSIGCRPACPPKFVPGCARRTRNECSQLSCSRRGGSLAPARFFRRGGRFCRQALLNARADSACSCFIAAQPVYYRGPPAYSRRPSTRPSGPKGAPGLAQRPSQANRIPAGDLDQC
jgi:hypothetical protein